MLVLGGSHDKPNSARCRPVEYAHRRRVLFIILVIDVSLVRSRWLFFFTSLGVIMGSVLSFQHFCHAFSFKLGSQNENFAPLHTVFWLHDASDATDAQAVFRLH